MRKIKSLLMLCAVSFLLTGCVKFNANMDIKKDKSMDYTIIYAFDTSMFGDQSTLSDDDKTKLNESGFEVQEYNEDKWKGFTITKKIANIDEVSSVSEEVSYSLSDLLNENNMENSNIFKVKKGFFKNVYKAKLKFSSGDSSLSSDEEENDAEIEEYDDETYDNEENNEAIDNEETDLSDQLSSITNSMDLSYNVKLPYAAISNNANQVSDDKMSLSWSFTSNKVSYAEFEFPIYNMTNIYITIGIAVIIIGGAVIIIFKRKR